MNDHRVELMTQEIMTGKGHSKYTDILLVEEECELHFEYYADFMHKPQVYLAITNGDNTEADDIIFLSIMNQLRYKITANDIKKAIAEVQTGSGFIKEKSVVYCYEFVVMNEQLSIRVEYSCPPEISQITYNENSSVRDTADLHRVVFYPSYSKIKIKE